MSKLPIGAVYPAADASVNRSSPNVQVLFNNATGKPLAIPQHNDSISGLASHFNPIAFCVDGVFLWLLLIWITAGTAAMITLLVKSCRNRWKGHQDFDWEGLEASIRPNRQHPTAPSSFTTRSTTISTAASSTCQPRRATTPPPLPLPNQRTNTRRSILASDTVRRGHQMKSSVCHTHRSTRRLQSTQA